MKVVNKIILIIQILIVIFIISPLTVKAFTEPDSKIKQATLFEEFEKNFNEVPDTPAEEVIDGGDSFFEAGRVTGNPLQEDRLQEVSSMVYNVLLTVGIIVAVIMGLYLAIKIMLSSVEEKAEYKQMLIPYIIGCIVVFGAFTIWKIVVDLLNQTQ